MAHRRADYEDDEWQSSGPSPQKCSRNDHPISESDYEFQEEGDSYEDRFQNPDYFLKQFGGYESNSEDPDEDDEDKRPQRGSSQKKGKRNRESEVCVDEETDNYHSVVYIQTIKTKIKSRTKNKRASRMRKTSQLNRSRRRRGCPSQTRPSRKLISDRSSRPWTPTDSISICPRCSTFRRGAPVR
jgi:hypothetical protein